MRERKGNRAWLNPDKTHTASIAWNAEDGYGYLEIRDCNRTVTLEFPYRNQSKRKSLAKLDRMIELMNELRKEMGSK